MPTDAWLRGLGLRPWWSLPLVVLSLPACSDDAGTANGSGGTTAGTSALGGAAGSSVNVAGNGGNAAGSSGDGVSGAGGSSAGSSGAAGATSGTCAPATALVCDTQATFPASIKDTGIFPALPDLAQRHPSAHFFEPNPPLWSDGLAKERLLILPPGTAVDSTDATKWKFPMGTLLVKTFFDDSGPNKSRRPIETRFLRHGQDPIDPFSEWEFAVYQWNSDSTDATLVSFDDPMKSTPVQVVVDRMEGGKPLKLNGGQPFSHQIPAKQDCQSCHDANAKRTEADVIGFDALRLNWKLPNAAKTQLETLVEQKLVSSLPSAPARIAEPNPVLARVEAWVYGNCVHCHNGAEGMLDLQPSVFVTNTVNQASQGAGTMPPSAEWKRVVPKLPELSILYVQARRTPLPMGDGVQMRAMPPVGVAEVDSDAVVDIATWITSL